MEPETEPVDVVGEISVLLYKLTQVDPEHELLRFAASIRGNDIYIDLSMQSALYKTYAPNGDRLVLDVWTEFLGVLDEAFIEAVLSVPSEYYN